MVDPISDLIIRIKNAGLAKNESVVLPYSNLKNSIAQKLRSINYISNVETAGHGIKKNLVVTLLYDKSGKHKVNDVKRVSKRGCRVYFGSKDIRPIKNNYGVLIMSTPKGVLTGAEARKGGVGGEALFSIW